MKIPKQLDRRIEIWRPVETVDGFGQRTQVYQLFKPVWAHYDPNVRIGRFEGEQDRQIVGTSTVLFTIRCFKTWKPNNKDQVRFEGSEFEVQNVIEHNRKEYYVIQAKERGQND